MERRESRVFPSFICSITTYIAHVSKVFLGQFLRETDTEKRGIYGHGPICPRAARVTIAS
jgi:hypothetical protein